jgi:hypothetical protein
VYIPVPPQPDCVSAWREAVRLVNVQPGHQAYNVIIDVTAPTKRASVGDPAIAVVNSFLLEHGSKAVETVANTIFPAALYRRHGAPKFFTVFRDRVLPKVRSKERWSGYYFERIMQLPQPGGEPINQIWSIVERIRNPSVRALNKFEISIFDPVRDVDNSPYGGQCLSFGSFKLVANGAEKSLALTVMYRNHYYIEKLLGNLIGLGRLMHFVAKETDLVVGPLTVVSTHAVIDQPKGASRADILAMLSRCDQATACLPPSAT